MRRRLAVLAAVSLATISTPVWANEFLDYFEYGQTELSAQGYGMARRVVQYVEATPDPHVTVLAHMDGAEAVEFSDELAALRAQSVATELVRLGVNPARIQMWACANSLQARPTDPGVREQLNRRVTVGVVRGTWSPSQGLSENCRRL